MSHKNPSLEKRGKGRFYDDIIILRIPPDLPLPKGGISGILMPLCRPEFYAGFINNAG
jgi:hypothetical protein